MVFAQIILFISIILLILARYPVAHNFDVSKARSMFVVIVWLSLWFVSLISLKGGELWLAVPGGLVISSGLLYLMNRSIEGRRLIQTSAPREYFLIAVSIAWLSQYAQSQALTYTTVVVCITSGASYVFGRYIGWSAQRKTVSVRVEYTNLVDHVVLFGYRDLTVMIIKALHAAHIPYVIVESSHQKVLRAKINGFAVVESSQGTEKEFLTYSAIGKSKCLIMLNPADAIAEQLLLGGKKINPSLFVLATVKDEPGSQRLTALGADVVLQQDFELALSIIKHIAVVHKMKREHVTQLLQKLRFIQGASN